MNAIRATFLAGVCSLAACMPEGGDTSDNELPVQAPPAAPSGDNPPPPDSPPPTDNPPPSDEPTTDNSGEPLSDAEANDLCQIGVEGVMTGEGPADMDSSLDFSAIPAAAAGPESLGTLDASSGGGGESITEMLNGLAGVVPDTVTEAAPEPAPEPSPEPEPEPEKPEHEPPKKAVPPPPKPKPAPKPSLKPTFLFWVN